jgi:hypothetical protein
MIPFADYKVTFRSEAFIADIATACRAIGTKPGSRYVDLQVILDELQAHGVESIYKIRGVRTKGRLTIELSDDDSTQPKAHVEFKPRLTLRVQRSVWKYFQDGHSEEREIIAHEIGHIMLHDDNAKPFSQDGSLQVSYAEDEDSAEWQANRFADHILIPTALAQEIHDANQLAILTNVTELFAFERLAAVRSIKRPLTLFSDGPCAACGSPLVLNVLEKTCSWCGHKST